MAVKTKQQQQSLNNDYWLYGALGILTLFIALSPKYQAYFNGVGLHSVIQYSFEKPVSYGLIFGIIGLIYAAIYQLRKGDIDQRYIMAWLGLVVPAAYMASSYDAVSSYLSRISDYFQIGAYGFFVIGIMLSESKRMQNYLAYIYLIVGSMITLYSFGFLLGNQYQTDALSFVESVRLASVFTYTNAYAAFLLTLLLVNLHYLVMTRNRIAVIALSAPLLWITSSLLLTLSRGAMIALPVIILITLLISGIRKQLLMCIYMIAATILSFFVQTKLQAIGLETFNAQQQVADPESTTRSLFSGSSLAGWMTVIGFSLLLAGLIYLFHKFILGKLENKLAHWDGLKSSRWIIPAIYFVLGTVGIILLSSGALNFMLPEALAQRIGDISFNTHSVLERIAIYKDSTRLWQDHIWFGAGGGAWEATYDAYQSYPYMSAQTHSYLMQILVETGLVGFILIVGFIGYILARYVVIYIKHRKTDEDVDGLFWLITLSLLIHSMIDFEMSYFFFTALVFLSLGILAGEKPRSIIKLNKPATKKWLKIGSSALLIVIGIVALTLVGKSISANNKFWKSVDQIREQAGLSAMIQTLEEGLNQSPGHPYLLEQAGRYYYTAFQQTREEKYRTEALKYWDKLKKAEPKMRSINVIDYTVATEAGDHEQAARIMDEAISSSPFEVSYYANAIRSHYEVYKSAEQQSDEEKQRTEGQAIERVYKLAEERVAELGQLNKAIHYDRQFAITDEMKQIYDNTRG